MRITYDRAVDALYFRFRDTTVTTKHLSEGIAADYDSDGRLAGIEILDATRQLGDPSVLPGHPRGRRGGLILSSEWTAAPRRSVIGSHTRFTGTFEEIERQWYEQVYRGRGDSMRQLTWRAVIMGSDALGEGARLGGAHRRARYRWADALAVNKPPSLHAAGAYAGCQLFIEMIRRGGDLDSEKVREQLLSDELKRRRVAA